MDAQTALRRFTTINGERLRRAAADLGARFEGVLEVLPLLFHTNDPLLPGFTDEEVPAGFPAYTPTRGALEYARTLAKSEGKGSFKVGARRRFDLHSALLFTDAGTLGGHGESPLELWLLTRPDLAGGERQALAGKAEGIIDWLREDGLTLHVRILDAAPFSADGGGLTVGSPFPWRPRLMLDRLYGRALWLAGRLPDWWLVPPEQEADYDHAVAAIGGQLGSQQLVSLGRTGQLPPEELFPASAECLFRAVDDPGRILISVFQWEAYAKHPGRLLSRALKRAVYRGETHLNALDPQVLGYRLVEEYLRDEPNLLEPVRHSLYFLTGQRLSERVRGEADWRREAMEELVRSWGWGDPSCGDLDARREWKLERVLEERHRLVGAISHAYRELSALGRAHAEAVRGELTTFGLLRQKLYSAFERKAGKVERVDPGLAGSLAESHLNIYLNSARGGCLLYRKADRERDGDQAKPLKRAASFVELMSWCHFNRLIDKHTLVALFPPEGVVEQREMRRVLEVLRDLATEGGTAAPLQEAFARPAVATAAALFINVGVVDPLTRRTRQGIHLSGEIIDPFSYGSRQESIAETFDLVLTCDRGEVHCFRFRDDNALPDCLSEIFAWVAPGGRPPPLPAHCFSTERCVQAARAFDTLYQDMVERLYGDQTEGARYVLRFRQAYYLFQRNGEGCGYRRAENAAELMALLAAPRSSFSPLAINPGALMETPLPVIHADNQPGRVQLFYYPRAERAELFVLDEHGSLYTQTVPFEGDDALISHYQRFFGAVLPRRSLGAHEAEPAYEEPAYHRIARGKDGAWSLIPQETGADRDQRRYFNVHVIAEQLEDRRTNVTVFCDEEEFSSLEHGEELFREIARYVLGRRKNGERYPIYITDIDIHRLVGGAAGGGPIQTIHFLNYKKRIEDRLNEALREV